MIVKSSSKENNTVTFQVELDPAEFEKHVDAAYKKNRSRIQVPGFRRGKASRMVIEGFYGKDVFYDDAMEDAANEAFMFGVEQESLRAVGRPSLTDMHVTEEKGALLSFTTDVWPEVTLGQYKGLEAEKDPCDVTEEEIDREINRLRKQNGRLVSVDRPAENGDTVNIDYRGEKNGEAFDGGSAEGYNLVLGSNSFIPGFEDKLIGITAGEERDLELTFPEEYHAKELAGQAVVFHVKCNEINNAFTDRLVDAAVNNMSVEVPPSMIEAQMDSMVEDYSRYISSQGIPFEQYVKMMGGTVETFRETTRSAAVKQLRTEILLDAVAKAENLEATEEDMKTELEALAKNYSMSAEDVEKYVDKEALTEQIIRKKATAVISDSGIPVAPKAKTEAEEPAAEE